MIARLIYFGTAAAFAVAPFVAFNHKSIAQLRVQVDEDFSHRLHCLTAHDAPDWMIAREVGGIGGILKLYSQARIHIGILAELGESIPDRAEADIAETRLLAILECLRSSGRTSFPVLRRAVNAFCEITTTTDCVLNQIDAIKHPVIL